MAFNIKNEMFGNPNNYYHHHINKSNHDLRWEIFSLFFINKFTNHCRL